MDTDTETGNRSPSEARHGPTAYVAGVPPPAMALLLKRAQSLFKTFTTTTMSNIEHALLGMGYVPRSQDGIESATREGALNLCTLGDTGAAAVYLYAASRV